MKIVRLSIEVEVDADNEEKIPQLLSDMEELAVGPKYGYDLFDSDWEEI